MGCCGLIKTLFSLRLILRLCCMMAAYSCWFGIFFEGWNGGVCLLDHSTQACRLTFTTGLISWIIALTGVLGTFRETHWSPKWMKRVSFFDMVVSGILALAWACCFMDLVVCYWRTDAKEIETAHITSAVQMVVSLSFFSLVGWLGIALLQHRYWKRYRRGEYHIIVATSSHPTTPRGSAVPSPAPSPRPNASPAASPRPDHVANMAPQERPPPSPTPAPAASETTRLLPPTHDAA